MRIIIFLSSFWLSIHHCIGEGIAQSALDSNLYAYDDDTEINISSQQLDNDRSLEENLSRLTYAVLITPEYNADGLLLDELAITMESIRQIDSSAHSLALITHGMLAQLSAPLAFMGYRAIEIDLPIHLGSVQSHAFQRCILQERGLSMYLLGALKLVEYPIIVIMPPGNVIIRQPSIPTGSWTVATISNKSDYNLNAFVMLRTELAAFESIQSALKDTKTWLSISKQSNSLPMPFELLSRTVVAGLGESSLIKLPVNKCNSSFLLPQYPDMGMWCAENFPLDTTGDSQIVVILRYEGHPCTAREAGRFFSKKIDMNVTMYPCGPAHYRIHDGSGTEDIIVGRNKFGSEVSVRAPRKEDTVQVAVQQPKPEADVRVDKYDMQNLQHYWLANKEFKIIYLAIPKVACTQMIQLFLRAAGAPNWSTNEMSKIHFNKYSGRIRAKSLFTPEQFSNIMNDPTWTKAVMVREPRERLLSAYLDKYVLHGGYGDRIKADKQYVSFEEFVESIQADTRMKLSKTRPKGNIHHLSFVDPHHRPQSLFMEKFLPYMNFIAEYTHAEEHIKELLIKVGMWDKFGSTGWGLNGTQAIYQSDGSTVKKHSTNSESLHELFYTPELEQRAIRGYAIDYQVLPDFWDAHPIIL